MKNAIIIFLVFMFFSNIMVAQKAKIGITFSAFSDNEVVRFSNSYVGDASYDANSSYTIGFTYLKPLNNWLEIETGIEYINGSITVHPAPMIQRAPHTDKVSFLNIPISVRASFWKYCFANGGLIIDTDLSLSSPIDAQVGVGAMLGVGLEYDFKSGISLFVNPYAKVHTLVPFSFNSYSQRFLESAVRFGITYQL
jgi:hypothetical protein